MSGAQWRDLTSSSVRARGGEPDSWELKGILFRILVHRFLNYGGWWLTCFDLRIDRQKLESESAEDAREEALRIVDGRLASMRKEFDTAIKPPRKKKAKR